MVGIQIRFPLYSITRCSTALHRPSWSHPTVSLLCSCSGVTLWLCWSALESALLVLTALGFQSLSLSVLLLSSTLASWSLTGPSVDLELIWDGTVFSFFNLLCFFCSVTLNISLMHSGFLCRSAAFSLRFLQMVSIWYSCKHSFLKNLFLIAYCWYIILKRQVLDDWVQNCWVGWPSSLSLGG